MSYLYMIVLCIVGLFMTTLNRVSSWMVWDGSIEWFEVLVAVVVWGGSLGCELPQSCALQGHVWLIE